LRNGFRQSQPDLSGIGNPNRSQRIITTHTPLETGLSIYQFVDPVITSNAIIA
jgi:hypothetical protein